MATTSRVKGITVPIGGDTSGLDKALRDVTQQTNSVNKELRDVDRLMKAVPGNANLISQKQELLAKQVETTTERLNRLREVEDEVERQFKSGDLGEAQFRNFQREIIDTENELSKFGSRLESVTNGDVVGPIQTAFEKLKSDIDDTGESLDSLSGITKSVSKELYEVDRLLKRSPESTELLAQKEELLALQISNTTKQLDKMRNSQYELQKLVESGDIGQDEFRAFQREIVKAESNLDDLSNAYRDLTNPIEAVVDVVDDVRTASDKLNESLNDIAKDSDRVVRELKAVDDLLDFDPSNIELTAQKQALLAEQSQLAERRLRELEDAYEDLDREFKSGVIGDDVFREFERDIIRSRQEIEKLNGTPIIDEKVLSDMDKIDAELRNIVDESRSVSRELKEVQDLLKLDPGNVRLVAQEQDLLADKARNTTKRLKELEDAQDKLDNAFRSGKIDVSNYNRAQREIEELKIEMRDLADVAEEVSEEVSGSFSDLGGVLAGVGAAMGIEKIVDEAFDLSNYETTLSLSMDLDDDAMVAVDQAIKQVSVYGVDADEALSGVRRQWLLNRDATNEANESVAVGAGIIARAYNDVDFLELIQETNEIASSLNVSNDEALALVDSLFRVGFPTDQLDIIAEYGKQLTDAGYNAEQVRAILASAAGEKSWNVDNLLDGLKEGRVRAAEFGTEVSTGLVSVLESIGNDSMIGQIQNWGKAIAAGGEAGAQSYSEMVNWLNSIEDSTLRNTIGTELFGTMWEDQGEGIINTMLGMNDNLVSLNDMTETYNDTTSIINDDPYIEMQNAIMKLREALEPTLRVIADVVGEIANFISRNPELAASIVKVIAVVGILGGIIVATGTVLTNLSAIAGVFGISLAGLASPIGIIIAAIAGFIAIGVALYKNWDQVSGIMGAIFNGMSDSAQATISGMWTWIKDFTSGISSWFSGSKESVKQGSVTMFSGLWEGMLEKLSGVKDNVKGWINGLVDMFKGIDMKDIGSNIIDGLALGMSNSNNGLLRTVGDISKGIIGRSRKVLDINSPSGEFETIGMFSGEGLVRGLQNMTKRVRNASAKMTAGALDGVDMRDGNYNIGIDGASVNGRGYNGDQPYQPVFNIANLNVRDDQDIHKISRELYRLDQNNKRGLGLGGA